MKEIVGRLKENRDIEMAKQIMEAAGYKVEKKLNESAEITESYKGLNIAPFREFNKNDYYAYAGAPKIGDKEPLIFSGTNAEVLICGNDLTDNKSLCTVEVYVGEYGDGYYLDTPVSFPKALRMGKEVASMDDDYEKLLYWCEDNLESY